MDRVRAIWGRYRAWPLWAQVPVGIVVGFLALSIAMAPFVDPEEDTQKVSAGQAATTATEPPATTLAPTSATQAPQTTTVPTTVVLVTTTVAPVTTARPTTTARPAPSDPRAARLTQTEYGDAWPFTVPEGTVRCVGASSVVFDAGGRTYAVNGTARSQTEFPDIDPIWRDNPTISGLKVNIGPIIDKGLSLCSK